MDTFLFPLLLQVVLIALNAIFACAEIAVISLNDSKVAKMAEDGNRRAKRLQRFVEQPSSFLSTIQIAITLSGFLGSAFAADNFSDTLTEVLLAAGVPLSAKVLDTISVIVITVILSYFTLIFGELVPKRLAMKKSEQLAMAMSAMLTMVAKIFAPIVWVLTMSTNGILRLLGIDPNADDEEISEEEIQTMVDAGTRKGVFDVQEQQFIQNIFQFDDRTVEEFCTHRTEIAFLRKGDCMEKWENIIHTTRHSRYPICEDSLDHVIGILNVKDYFALHDKTYNAVMAHAVHTPFYVPESVRADVLFRQMKQSRRHFAVVLDEYGSSRMIRSQEWKYIHRYPYGPHELYHLTQDPGEKENLVDRPEYAQIQAQMLDALQNWYCTYADPAVDGTREGVTGFGQMRRPGIHSQGKPVYATSPKYQKS